FLAANTPTVVTTSAVAWGIESGWNTTSTGTVTVEALTTGGWASTTVSCPWEISFNILGAPAAADARPPSALAAQLHAVHGAGGVGDRARERRVGREHARELVDV